MADLNLNSTYPIAFIMFMCAASISRAQTVVVPSGLDNVDGNSASGPGPAVNKPQTIRYQQVYAASEFGLLANAGGGWIVDSFSVATPLAARLACICRAYG